MDVASTLKDLNLDDSDKPIFQYVDVFKNPSKMPINQIHLERASFHLKKEIPKEFDFLTVPAKDLKSNFYDKKVEVIPALDVRWLPKCVLYKFEPYVFNLSREENDIFVTNNVMFMESLEYLLKCNFHQFWCTILFEPTAVLALRSFVLNPIPPYEARYLDGEHRNVYNRIFNMFQLVYERLITFKASETEYMKEDYGLKILIDKKLINLPIVNTLAWLYKKCNLGFVNNLTTLYFNDTSQLDFQIKEVEEIINQNVRIFDVISRHVCRFDTKIDVLPIALKPRPSVFDLSWVYSVVNYLLNAVSLLNTLLQFYKPAVEICFNKELPFRISSTYVTVYNELYEMLVDREELTLHKELSDKVFDEINLGRSEFVDLFHSFVSHCLDKTLAYMNDNKQQEHIIEIYIRLLTSALEDEYFICDYDQKYSVATQNEMFENCSSLDTTRTQFIVSCLNKLSRHKKLGQLSKLSRQTIENVFKEFKPPELIQETSVHTHISLPENSNVPKETEIEIMIKDIIDMFPHLGDGFVLKCLESYSYNSSDAINAILEENLPPHLYEIPFDSIRIPPEPEPEKPALAYWGKKPDYEDAMSLLNDKTDIKQMKTFVLDGVQYNNQYLYDDEYDDRDDDDVPIKVADNPLEKEVLSYNPNHEDLASDTSYSSDDDYDDTGKPIAANSKNEKGATSSQSDRSKRDFCVDPAILRAQREAKFRPKRPPPAQSKSNIVGKPKGQGQDKEVLKARDKKNVNKSSRANHNRKSGAQWKRTRGMVPS